MKLTKRNCNCDGVIGERYKKVAKREKRERQRGNKTERRQTRDDIIYFDFYLPIVRAIKS